MSIETTAKYQTDQDSTQCLIPFSVEENKLFLPDLGDGVLELEKIFHFELPQVQAKTKLKGWGLFKGLKIDEKDIEDAKKSLFPEREF